MPASHPLAKLGNKAWYGKLSANQKTVIDEHCTNAWAQRIGVEKLRAELKKRNALQ